MATKLKRTPLYADHVQLGAKLVPFAGFEMPVQYPSGVASEHRAVRERAGLFDVSHMGEFMLTGDDAEVFVNHVVTNDVSRLGPGQAQYTMMCREDGGIVDDLLVYKFADRIRLVVNAANITKDFDWIESRLGGYGKLDVELSDESESIALIALQGPKSAEILQPLSDIDLSRIGYYHFGEGRVAEVPCVVSRTGYTGEDGFELYCEAPAASRIWTELLEAGSGTLLPAGLGARDTLRLEMGYPLYGNDIDDETTPLEAGLGWTVKLDKGDFVGRGALAALKARGIERRLSGFVLRERGFPRPGYEVRVEGSAVATVRSGSVGPSVGQGIGTVYLPISATEPGTPIEVVIRGRAVAAEVVRMPFYKDGSIKR
ncbi:MAG: glycine cleavage system aminomethyltransferase GcvT [Gemmatimonadota bacterium]|nr:MAG: glycine cleavage system aminomethyltransferase GcvT [Gemmatimonadota bacterium]